MGGCRYSDPDLSELGTRQALLLGQHVKEGADPIAEHLRGWKAMGDRFGLYSSPMRRALKTTWGLARGLPRSLCRFRGVKSLCCHERQLTPISVISVGVNRGDGLATRHCAAVSV